MHATANDWHLPGDICLTKDQLLEFVYDLVHRKLKYDGSERRAAERHLVVMDVPAVPLDDALRPIGDPFVAISRNISSSGVSLFHTKHIEAPFLGIELRDEIKGTAIRAAMEILRCLTKGHVVEIAGRFVYKTYEKQQSP